MVVVPIGCCPITSTDLTTYQHVKYDTRMSTVSFPSPRACPPRTFRHVLRCSPLYCYEQSIYRQLYQWTERWGCTKVLSCQTDRLNIGIDILFEASSPEAIYDSGARNYALRCFPGTREQYIEDTVEWAIPAPYNSSLPLFWMNRAAGFGKSAIAQTSAEKIKKSGMLGVSFISQLTKETSPSFISFDCISALCEICRLSGVGR